jgi:hypothetical protein
MKRKSPPDDRIRLFERLLKGPEETGAEQVDMPTDLCRYILELAKRAPQPGRGRRETSGRVKVKEALIISRARYRKAQLQAEGMPSEHALDQAADEAAKRLPHLQPSTVRRRMQRKAPRR